MFERTSIALLSLALLAHSTHAQIVVGTSDDVVPNMVWHIDLATGSRTPLFRGPASAIAVDDPSGTVYVVRHTVQLFRWTYGSTQPLIHIGQTHTAAGVFTPVNGLAYGAGRMFAALEPGAGLAEVDPSTAVVTPIAGLPAWFRPESLSFDPTSSLFYAYVDYQNGNTNPGLYSIDLLNGGQPVHVVTAPPPLFAAVDADALAIGGGRAYIVSDDWQAYDVYDFASASYTVGVVTSPFSIEGFQSGAEWAPSLVPPPVPRVYCDGKTNSVGCAPKLNYVGVPSASAPSGFDVVATRARANVFGGVCYSVTGRATTPFGGGTLCISAPLKRTVTTPAVYDSTPNLLPACHARFAFDFNLYIASGADPALVAGQGVWLQFISRDPGFAQPDNLGLSPALELTLQP
jgi:hypothetical protein